MKKTLAVLVIAAAGIGGYWYLNQGEQPSGRPRGGAVTVIVEQVQPQLLVDVIEALGTANANESVELTASLTDTVRQVNFDDGDYVEAGTVLVELTNEEESAQLAEARANLDDAERQLRRLQDLDKRGIAATSDVDEARALAEGAEARLNTVLARLEDRLIRAPFSGMLGFRNVSPGTLLMTGDAITTIDDISQIKLDFTLPEHALRLMAPGRTVYARSAAWGDREFEGEVRTVGSRVDPVTRAIVVRAIIPNEDRALLPGMLLTVRAVTDEREALMVPEKAVVQISKDAFVYVVGADNIANRVLIELGTRQPGRVEIRSGLEQGDTIVTEGVIKLRPGIQVSIQGDAPSGRFAAPDTGGPPLSATDPARPPQRPDGAPAEDDKS